jgi:hypothetical protein
MFWSLDLVINDFSRFLECPGGGRTRHRRGQPQSVFIVYRHDETGLACEIETMEMVSFGLEDHGRPYPALKREHDLAAREIRASYPLLRGQNRIARTISQTTPQPIHVMFG